MPVGSRSDGGDTTSVAMLGTYPPRLCGLATFGAALAKEFVRAGRQVRVVAVEDSNPVPAATPGVDTLRRNDPASASRTARILSACDVALVQHEFGIYGGPDGDELLEVLSATEAPIVVVLHTVPLRPTAHQRVVLEAVCAAAASVVVMTATAASRLALYDIDERKATVIPHGAWSTGPARQLPPPTVVKLLTWGLLGPGKGVEHMISAMALLGGASARVRYTVAGVTHPNVRLQHGEEYRTSLIRRAWSIGVAPAVHFDDTYRDVASLLELVRSASVVVLPYDSADQVTSGVLVDAIAAGVPVIATAFPHAVELLSDGAGLLVPHRDPAALAAAVRSVTVDPTALHRMTERACTIAPTLAWSAVAAQYLSLFDLVRTAGAAPVAG